MSFTRIAGFGGIVFIVTVAVANIGLAAAGKPLGNAELSAIVSFYTDHGGLASRLTYVAPLAWLAIALFSSGVVVLTRTSEGGHNPWAIVGLAGVAMMVPTFAGVITADSLLAVRASMLGENPEYTRMLWDFHMILQILNWTFVAIALGGFGMAAASSGTAPRLGKAAVAGALLLLAGATQSVPGLAGTLSVLVGLPGFLVWLVFVAGYSVVLIRVEGRTGQPA